MYMEGKHINGFHIKIQHGKCNINNILQLQTNEYFYVLPVPGMFTTV